ncbi:MAG: hypothetical protein WBA28_05030 [Microbacteriaceae bacterium]
MKDHIQFLLQSGMGTRAIAERAGVGRTLIRTLLHGRQDSADPARYLEVQKRIGRERAEKILAVQPSLDTLLDGAYIPSLEYRRKLQSLVRIGWSMSKLGARLGITPQNMNPVMHSNRMMTVRLARQINTLWEELWDRKPVNSELHDRIAYVRSVNYAKARRWLSPLELEFMDEETEEAGVDMIAVELAMKGDDVRLNKEERRIAIRKMNHLGYSDKAIAERLGIWDRTVLRIRQELGLKAAA